MERETIYKHCECARGETLHELTPMYDYVQIGNEEMKERQWCYDAWVCNECGEEKDEY